ncbi:MAG TPA: hypothetical protein VKU01_15470 [Bryobacteraceae bacterium]|nr:hypothetical protein [Bryobacteraceae bacterium]
MNKLQFRVLYREFLFRMVDLELLSVQGDMTKLLGQFASLLIFASLTFSLPALNFPPRWMTPAQVTALLWSIEHFLIATTMLVIGLFAVLSWDSTFPNKHDVMVLAPLPVRTRTLFFAKVSAMAAALGITVVTVNALSSVTWTSHIVPAGSGFLGVVRSFAAYWLTMFASGTFLYCSVLGVQGLTALLLPRRVFLRVSAFLQMAAFCLFLCAYFLEPNINTPAALSATQNQRALAWLPDYWFLGLFHALNGSLRPFYVPLAQRAVAGLAIVATGAAGFFVLSYFRTLRKIVEEPDIVPGARGWGWTPSFGNSLDTAVVWFSTRTLLRSRQHRVMLAFYSGVGFAFAFFLMHAGHLREQVVNGRISIELMVSSLVMMCTWVVGMRVVFSMPLTLRANWVFQTTAVRSPSEYLKAIRRPLFVLGVTPVWILSAGLFLWLFPWRPAAQHLVVLLLWGLIVAYLSLHEFQKIPFTCSYLPGKSYFHMTFLAAVGLLVLMVRGVLIEYRALQNPASFAVMTAVLAAVALIARWRAVSYAASEAATVEYEDRPTPAILPLGLNRDGVWPV